MEQRVKSYFLVSNHYQQHDIMIIEYYSIIKATHNNENYPTINIPSVLHNGTGEKGGGS